MNKIETATEKLEQLLRDAAFAGFVNKKMVSKLKEIIDTLHAQQPCAGCEKLREKISHFADSLRRVGWPREADKLDEILAQPCRKPQEDSNSQAVEAAIDILDGNKEPIDWRKGGHELLRKLCEHLEVCSNPPQPQASAGSEEWTVEDKFGCWQIWSAKGCEGDHLPEVAAKSLCQSHNAALRRQSAPVGEWRDLEAGEEIKPSDVPIMRDGSGSLATPGHTRSLEVRRLTTRRGSGLCRRSIA